MDDCVVNWFDEAMDYVSKHTLPSSRYKKLSHDDYHILKNHTRFYRHLDLLPGATELVQWATQFTTKNDMFFAFLTAIPHDGSVPFAPYDKVQWTLERFPTIPVFFGPYSTDKWKHCKPTDILIDDRLENCNDWKKAGGIAHQYTTWENCQEWIKQQGFD